jgi:hypothetical protein
MNRLTSKIKSITFNQWFYFTMGGFVSYSNYQRFTPRTKLGCITVPIAGVIIWPAIIVMDSMFAKDFKNLELELKKADQEMYYKIEKTYYTLYNEHSLLLNKYDSLLKENEKKEKSKTNSSV